jgi:hypothetical protein
MCVHAGASVAPTARRLVRRPVVPLLRRAHLRCRPCCARLAVANDVAAGSWPRAGWIHLIPRARLAPRVPSIAVLDDGRARGAALVAPEGGDAQHERGAKGVVPGDRPGADGPRHRLGGLACGQVRDAQRAGQRPADDLGERERPLGRLVARAVADPAAVRLVDKGMSAIELQPQGTAPPARSSGRTHSRCMARAPDWRSSRGSGTPAAARSVAA